MKANSAVKVRVCVYASVNIERFLCLDISVKVKIEDSIFNMYSSTHISLWTNAVCQKAILLQYNKNCFLKELPISYVNNKTSKDVRVKSATRYAKITMDDFHCLNWNKAYISST